MPNTLVAPIIEGNLFWPDSAPDEFDGETESVDDGDRESDVEKYVGKAHYVMKELSKTVVGSGSFSR